jgi:hypothetical protein
MAGGGELEQVPVATQLCGSRSEIHDRTFEALKGKPVEMLEHWVGSVPALICEIVSA